MESSLVKDPDGGITLHLQNESPGGDEEANWLPAPKGPFQVVLRLYWPKPDALNGTWQAHRSPRRCRHGANWNVDGGYTV
jgi:hypothetical protein